MAQPSATLQQKAAFFHGLGRVLTEENQYIFESQYASSHVMFVKDILGETVPFCADEATADAFVAANPSIVKKYTQATLVQVPNTNGQAWYIQDSGEWMKPILNEILIQNPTTNAPAIGFMPKLYSGVDNSLVSPGTGVWWVDPFAGMVRFGSGYTPSDLGIGTPKLTCFVYIGKTLTEKLDEISTVVGTSDFLYDSTAVGGSGPNTVHTIVHNLGSIFLDATIFVEDPESGWEQQLAKITPVDNNSSTLTLCFAANAKVLLRKKL